jgi:hypothetical protein
MSAYEFWSLVFTGVGACATAGTLIVVVVAAVLTYQQVREAVRARRLEGALAVLTHISAPELRNARRLVYTHHAAICDKCSSNPSWNELDAFMLELSAGKVDLTAFHTYLASLENIAILVMHDVAPDDIIEMYFARLAPHHWETLRVFVEFMRQSYGSSDFLQHFEMFNALLADKVVKHGPGRFLRRAASRKKRKLLRERCRHR